MGTMEPVIKRSKERIKRTAEVFTPEWLVDKMLMSLREADPTLFTDASKTFLEPAAGDGNFLVRILHFKLELNDQSKPVPVREILQSIYGVDLMMDNVLLARKRMLEVVAEFLHISYAEAKEEFGEIVEHNVVCHNALEWDFEDWSPAREQQGLISFENKAFNRSEMVIRYVRQHTVTIPGRAGPFLP